MTTMTLTAKSQCTFNKQLLEHIGARPGDKLVVQKLSDGSLKINAESKRVPLSALRGMLTPRVFPSFDEVQEAISQGYVERGLAGFRA